MLIAAFILVISLAAMVQFAVLSWRAGLLRLAGEPQQGKADSPVAPCLNLSQSHNFKDLYTYQELCPDLGGGDAPDLRFVCLYYRVLESLSALAGAILPKGLATGWAQGEMALCTRYTAVVLSQRLARNQAWLADVRSY
jgi:hypothetical protein